MTLPTTAPLTRGGTRLLAPLFALCLLAITACDDSNTLAIEPPPPEPEFLPVAEPAVEMPPAIGEAVLISTSFDLAGQGYVQEEFFLSGTASAFTNLNELGSDGYWEAEPGATADYRTRVLVYRPADAADFSGTAVVEWLNVTNGFDVPAGWGVGHVEALRRGHAWVNVTAQRVGIEGLEDAVLPLNLRDADPERYESLDHPGDSFSYDIFTQVTAAIRAEDGGILGDLRADVLLATGESQSASRLLTYINAIQPLYNAYDGFIVDSRYDSSQPLAQEPQVAIPAPERVLFRDDLETPVINFQAETDVIALGAVDERQPDSDFFRLWEVTGSAHNDNYQLVAGRDDVGVGAEKALVVENDLILGIFACDRPINSGPYPWVYMAALNALDNWVRTGEPAPEAGRMAVTDDQADFQYDDVGNVVGGLRTPYVDAPAARLSGEINAGLVGCRLSGTTTLFDAATMATRYVDRDGYVEAVAEATDAAVEAGYLLPEDAQRIKAAAGLQWDALSP
ncbi:alpha/beta hydrolase domain-containing protein [Pseudohaliea sp.]|uniref:alpha/beta hydrolase domain-containing protein n=1 Tax=Pseudohaliea sp. TaxID=2740289 RepID=UPI0032ED7C50